MKKTLKNIKELIENADYVLIGAGAGLTSSAGIDYSGEEFKKDFNLFIQKYHFTDLYSSSFYNFDTQEEYWAYWSKHIYFANIGRTQLPLYNKIHDLVKDKNYFVITTNVDDQFYKANFDKDKIFRVQGSYRYIQCSQACHDKLYDDTAIVKEMIQNIDKDLKVPSNLVPICPVCGKTMEPNLRKDNYFVQDELWYTQEKSYNSFIENARNKKVVLLEFGVGFNTPGIIRLPFEQLTQENDNWTLIRFNKNCSSFYDIEGKLIKIYDDINTFFK